MAKIKTSLFILSFCFFAFNMYSQQIKTVCFGTSKTYFVDLDDGPTGSLGSSYEWSILETNAAIIKGNGTNSVLVDWASTPVGNYTLQVIETNDSCLSSISTMAIRINSNPLVTTESASVCSGSTVQITASVTPTSSSDKFSWTYPDGASNPGDENSFEASIGGDYVVTVTDNHGCVSAPVTATLTVNPLPDATIFAGGNTTFCEGGAVELSAPSGLANYVWSKDGDVIGISAVKYSAVASGDYTVTTIDSNGCSATTNIPVPVRVNSLPTIDITLSGSAEFCAGDSTTLMADSSWKGLTYQWLDSGVEIPSQVENSYIATTGSNYSVKVIDEHACEATSDAITIMVRPNPDATIAYSTPATFCAGDSVVLNVPLVSGYSYQWSDSLGNIKGATNASYIASETSDYSIQIIDTNFTTFCTSTATTPVRVVKKVAPVVSSISED